MTCTTILLVATIPFSFGFVIGEEQQPAAPELTMSVASQALAGWERYQAGNVVSTFNGGQYADTNPDQQGYDFWSDGRYARLDRDSNGHHETIFLVENDELIYVGSLNHHGRFGHTASAYQQLRKQQFTRFEESLP